MGKVDGGETGGHGRCQGGQGQQSTAGWKGGCRWGKKGNTGFEASRGSRELIKGAVRPCWSELLDLCRL